MKKFCSISFPSGTEDDTGRNDMDVGGSEAKQDPKDSDSECGEVSGKFNEFFFMFSFFRYVQRDVKLCKLSRMT